MLRRTLVAGLVAAILAACSPPQADKQTTTPAVPDPAPVIEALYQPYLTEGATFPDFEHQAPWSDSLWAELQAMMARSQAIGEPILDFDPLIDAQDYQLTDLNVSTDGLVENSHATVRASFNNSGQPAEIVYDLVWEHDAWRVDNIRTANWDLRQIASAPAETATP